MSSISLRPMSHRLSILVRLWVLQVAHKRRVESIEVYMPSLRFIKAQPDPQASDQRLPAADTLPNSACCKASP